MSEEPVIKSDVNASETTPERSEATPASLPTKETNEVFLGGMIVTVICLLLLILAGTFGFFGYRLWQASQVERATPSIQELGEKPKENVETPTVTTSEPTPTAPTSVVVPAPTTPADLATLEVKVLNGGGARGSASTLTGILKKAGYAKAAFGNTVTDHKGVVIYYASASQGAAETLKTTVMKTYPAVTLVPAPAGDKDATAATLVIILGRE